jgi:hypothetical protein
VRDVDQVDPVLRQPVVIKIGNDAHDLAILVFVAPGTDAAAQRTLAAEHLLGHRLADDDHERRLQRVALGKIASGDEARAERFEIAGLNYAP